MRKNYSLNESNNLCFMGIEIPKHLSMHLAKTGGFKNVTSAEIKQEYFRWAAAILHSDSLLDFSKSIYLHSHTNVLVYCSAHGELSMRPSHILDGCGCKLCANDRMRKSMTDFLMDARKAHGLRYSYNKTQYVTTHDKIIVTCPIHGDFEIRAKSHIEGGGCQTCYSENTATLRDIYIMKETTKPLYKIGISTSPVRRAASISASNSFGLKFKVLETFDIKNNTKATKIEKWVHKTLSEYQNINYLSMDGGTELFSLNDLEVEVICGILRDISNKN